MHTFCHPVLFLAWQNYFAPCPNPGQADADQLAARLCFRQPLYIFFGLNSAVEGFRHIYFYPFSRRYLENLPRRRNPGSNIFFPCGNSPFVVDYLLYLNCRRLEILILPPHPSRQVDFRHSVGKLYRFRTGYMSFTAGNIYSAGLSPFLLISLLITACRGPAWTSCRLASQVPPNSKSHNFRHVVVLPDPFHFITADFSILPGTPKSQ